MKNKIVVATYLCSIFILIGCGSIGGEDKSNENSTVNGTTSPENGYNVYGGNQVHRGGIFEFKDYTLIGQGVGIKTFTGAYKYYLIANDGEGASTIFIDAVGGSNMEYYTTNITSNGNGMHVVGPPDGVYSAIGEQGYILIDASGDNLTSIAVYAK